MTRTNRDSKTFLKMVELPSRQGLLLSGAIADLQAPMPAEEALGIARAVAKRQREFCAGRTLAREALRRMGGPGDVVLPPSEGGRMPAWPAGFVGSITHTDTHGACAVAHTSEVRSVGVDMERCGRVVPRLWAQLFTDREIEILQEASSALQDRLATVMFCAKEAFYKLQYPLTGAWLGFHDVAVAPDPSSGTFRVEVISEVAPVARIIPALYGIYGLPYEGTVLCECWFCG